MIVAVIMAGGKGTRLSSVTGDEIPKPMVRIAGVPILERQLMSLKGCGITKFYIVVGHLGEKIREYFGDGGAFGVTIEYITEETPLGSAGALYYLKGKIAEDFFLVFGDTVFDIDLDAMLSYHRRKGGALTLLAHPNSHPFDSDLLVVDDDCKVTALLSKKEPRGDYFNLVNASFFLVSPRVLDCFSAPEFRDMEKDVVKGRMERYGDVYAYITTEYIKDVGTVSRLRSVGQDIVDGTVSARNRKHKQRCIFLDRDGTVNEYVGFVTKPDQLRLLPRAAEAIARINRSGYLAVIVSNQPVLARGEVDKEGMAAIWRRFERLLGECGAYVDGTYVCPHHPDRGFEGEVAALKIDCDCRKPKPGLFFRAAEELSICLEDSYCVGDSWRDIAAGIAAGCHTVRLTCGEPFAEGHADAEDVCSDLYEAVNYILNGEKENGDT